MATHSSTLAWQIPWMEEPGRLQFMGYKEWDMTERFHFHFSLSCIGEGNGNPLQCSCLENPRDGGAWWAAVYGGRTESDTTEMTQQQQQEFVLRKAEKPERYLQFLLVSLKQCGHCGALDKFCCLNYHFYNKVWPKSQMFLTQKKKFFPPNMFLPVFIIVIEQIVIYFKFL